MAKKSKTPYIIAAAAGLAVLLFRGKKAKAADLPPPPTPDPDPDPQPPGPAKPGTTKPAIPSNVIGGSPGFNWQPRGEWPTYATIIGGLSALGYNVPGDYWQPNMAENPQLMVKSKGAIKKFQSDYKHAVKALTVAPQTPGGVVVDGKTAPVKTLSVDGWMGPQTWKAFKWAYKNATIDSTQDWWKDWVDGGKGL